MASPAPANHPLTPPAETSSSQVPPTLAPPQTTSATQIEALLSQPATSLRDDGTSKRPRDHRLIHLLLQSHGVVAYQQRIPLQLMDFAYRYTSGILSDALHIQSEGYEQQDGGASTSKGRKGGQNKSEDGDLSLQNLRIAIASRTSYQFQGSLPKEFLKGLAEERNRVGLGVGLRDAEKGGTTIGGVKLPHERYCLTGVGWGLKDEWDSEGEESVDMEGPDLAREEDDMMQMDGGVEFEENGDEEGEGAMEDVFGDDGGGNADNGDEEMEDS